MHNQRFAAVVRALGGVVSRRFVVRGVIGALASLAHVRPAGTAARRARATTCDVQSLTPGEACYCLCATDPNYPPTPERDRTCRTGCDAWAGDDDLF